MKYTIEFTEVLYYLSQDIEADSEEEAIEKAFELMENDVIPIANSNMDYCISTERKEEPEPVLATRHSDNEVIDVTLTEDEAFEEGFRQGQAEHPADRDDRLYHEGVDDEAIDRAIHNNPLGVGFAQKDRKENK